MLFLCADYCQYMYLGHKHIISRVSDFVSQKSTHGRCRWCTTCTIVQLSRSLLGGSGTSKHEERLQENSLEGKVRYRTCCTCRLEHRDVSIVGQSSSPIALRNTSAAGKQPRSLLF